MPVARFLGSAWASVHGPGDPRMLLLWTLESRFRGLVAGPSPRPVPWSAVRAASAGLPVEFPAVRAHSPLAEVDALAGLAAAGDGDRKAALAAVGEAVRLARLLGSPRIFLEPGLVPVLGEVEAQDLGDPTVGWTRDKAAALLARRKIGLLPALDRVCRVLHALCRQHPEFQFSLTTGRNLRTVADREGLEAIFEDLAALKLGYWHDAAVAARRHQVLGEDQAECLERFANRLSGMSLGDSGAEGMGLLPGVGGVDWPLLASYVNRPGRQLPVALELDPSVDPGEMPGVRSFLNRLGL